MSQPEMNANRENWWQCLRFTKVFEGFSSAMQLGKLGLAVGAILVIFLAGWIMDGLTPDGSLVVVEAGGNGAMTELSAYAQAQRGSRSQKYEEFRSNAQRANEERLARILVQLELERSDDRARETVATGDVLDEIEDKYEKELDSAMELLGSLYEDSAERIDDNYAEASEDADSSEEALLVKQRDAELAKVESAFLGLFESLTGQGEVRANYCQPWINELVAIDPGATDKRKARAEENRDQLEEAVQLAEAYQLAQVTRGRGIFCTLVDFNSARFHGAVNALIFERDLGKTGQEIWQVMLSVCWLGRFHCIYAVIFGAIWLAVWSIAGGAICRITALRSARDERIGPVRALQFSLEKFWGFFSAPLVPLGIVAAICVVIVVCSILGAIPGIGEILVGIFMGLTLVGGFVITLMLVGLIAGMNLMYPTIAVEGSDGFDALSRSFSYVRARPWRMAFYTLVAAVYGAICYLFVRFFAYIMLVAVHSAVGASTNMDGASLISIKGKLDAIWPAPTFADLQPAINWMGLSFTEQVSALLIMLWVALVVGSVMGFVVSFFFSVNTKIYFLLRHYVDATDMEDVYVDQDLEEITAGAEVAEPAAAESVAEVKETPGEPADSPSESDSEEKPKSP